MEEAEFNLTEGDLFVKYDLKKCREELIERWLIEEGFLLANSVLERFKRGFIKFTEENEMDNLKIHQTCCSDSDAIERDRKTIKRR